MNNGSSTQSASRLTSVCQRLWELDANRLQPGHQYVLNPQVQRSVHAAAQPHRPLCNPQCRCSVAKSRTWSRMLHQAPYLVKSTAQCSSNTPHTACSLHSSTTTQCKTHVAAKQQSGKHPAASCAYTWCCCRQAGTAEQHTAQHTREVQQFLDAVMQTQCMQYAHQCLIEQVTAQTFPNTFSVLLEECLLQCCG